jgi:hypothetical protein
MTNDRLICFVYILLIYYKSGTKFIRIQEKVPVERNLW